MLTSLPIDECYKNILNFLILFGLLSLTLCAVPSPGRGRRLTQADENRWKELFIASSDGDRHAYTDLLTEMGDYLEGFCRRYLFSEDLVENCVQNCLIAIDRSKQTYDPKLPLAPWFFTIVKRKIVDEIRRKNRKSDLLSDASDYEDSQAHNFSSKNTPVSDSLNGEIDIEAATGFFLNRLPNQHREVLQLTKIDGYSIKETAEKLEISQSAAKVRVHRATKELTNLISKEFSKIHG